MGATALCDPNVGVASCADGWDRAIRDYFPRPLGEGQQRPSAEDVDKDDSQPDTAQGMVVPLHACLIHALASLCSVSLETKAS